MPWLTSTHFKNSVAEVRAAESGIAYQVWQSGPRPFEEFKEAFDATLRLIHSLGTGKALVDDRHMSPLTTAEQQWLSQDWMLRATGAGNYRYAAVLVAQDPVARLATHAVRNKVASHGPIYRDFESETEALAWLRNQPIIYSRF